MEKHTDILKRLEAEIHNSFCEDGCVVMGDADYAQIIEAVKSSVTISDPASFWGSSVRL